MPKYIWNLHNPDASQVQRLSQELNISQFLACLLVNRGLHDPDKAARFLSPSLSQLHDPFELTGMARVVERVERAIADREKILLYGDYDVDGITSVVILKRCLEMSGAAVQYHVPERLTEGYGLRPERILQAAQDGTRLIISVDSGIRAREAAAVAAASGVDLVVTDHHLPEHELPSAYEILNPNRPGCAYPDKNLAGVGVAFKLVQALLQRSGKERLIPSYLKIVSIGTIADIVPLVGENRVFVKIGLEGLKSPRNHGLRALLESAGVLGRQVDYSGVGFRIAPRINAVGRMGGTADAVRLFDSMEEEEARRIAARLSDKNFWRQQEQEQILRSIERKFQEEPDAFADHVIVLWDQSWHRGVIGIVASRVMENYGRPVLIASVEEGIATGSGRSFGAFHLLESLESCHTLFQKYGGHRNAAGFTIEASLLPDLRRQLNLYARQRFSEPPLPSISIDATVLLRDLNYRIWEEISRLEPFGFGNPVPLFQDDEILVRAGPFVLKEKHIKWRLDNSVCSEAMWWNHAHQLDSLKPLRSLRAVYQLEMNEFRGERNLVVRIRDIALPTIEDRGLRIED
ncbi:MAG TPA: single-stranded-DNA-specific exonuclease RecJ [Acidobacteriota bacterium]|jgi:single-stranded-DNA-specific exonuclease|nr:single-stranded-DNA-specific exonuclease RecJ [Acidobacteriota bacterium]